MYLHEINECYRGYLDWSTFQSSYHAKESALSFQTPIRGPNLSNALSDVISIVELQLGDLKDPTSEVSSQRLTRTVRRDPADVALESSPGISLTPDSKLRIRQF